MINDKPRTMRLRISCLILHNCEAVETCSPILDVNISVHDGSNLSWIVTNISQLPVTRRERGRSEPMLARLQRTD